MNTEYSTFNERYEAKETECEKLSKQLKQLKKDHDLLTKQSAMQKRKIEDFEIRYKGIDIGYVHAEQEKIKTLLYKAQVSERAAINDLFRLRYKLLSLFIQYDEKKQAEIQKMNTRRMTYKGPAEKFNDPVEGKNLKLHEEKLRDAMEWKGD